MRARAWISLVAVVMVALGLQVMAPTPASAAVCPTVSVTAISPSVGFVTGGTSVSIVGCGFTGAGTLSVTFGANAGTGLTVANDTSLTVTSPAGSAGSTPVTVRLHPASGPDLTGTIPYTYIDVPTITSAVPARGPEAGGTEVRITGTNLAPSGGSQVVDFGGTPGTGLTDVSSTGLTVTSPPGTGTPDLTVAVSIPGSGSATSNALTYTYVPAPTVTSVSPTSGPVLGGQTITLTGTGFQDGAQVFLGPSATEVTLDSSASAVSRLSDTTLVAVTRAGIVGPTNVVVVNPDGQLGALASDAPAAYSFSGTPVAVTSVAPATGSSLGGTDFTITGTGFLPGAQVTFKGAESDPPTVSNVTVDAGGTQATGITPAHPSGPVSVVVTNVGGGTATLAAGFNYAAAAAPTITSLSSTTGVSLGGASLTIVGTNFVAGSSVDFGGAKAVAPLVLDATHISVTAPAHAAGTVSVTVTLPDRQTTSLASAFTYTASAAPVITSISPATGTGGTAVAINGTGFAPGAIVSVGSAACIPTATAPDSTCLQNLPIVPPAVTPPPIIASPTLAQGRVPNAPGGASTVKITNPDGQVSTIVFTYTGPTGAPTLTAIAPLGAGTLGGTPVTLTGTNFVPGATVTFGTCPTPTEPAKGGHPPTAVTVSADGTTISATTPAGVFGLVDVAVTNPGGASACSANAFTFAASPKPTITSIVATPGPVVQVTITGTGFANTNGAATNASSDANVTIGGKQLVTLAGQPAPPLVTSATSITGIVPTAPAGAVDVAVMNPDGQGAIAIGGYTYPDDTTPPEVTATGTASLAPYTFGDWARSSVSVKLDAADVGGVGVKNVTYSGAGAQTIAQATISGAQATVNVSAQGTTVVTYTASDLADNASTPQTATVKIDSIAPLLPAAATVPSGGGTAPYVPGATTNQNVTVAFTCSDAGSGVATVVATSASTTTSSGTNPLLVTVTSAGSGQSVTGECRDVAGNVTQTTYSNINIVRTSPTISATATANGQPYLPGTWTNKVVTVTFTCIPVSASNQVASLTQPVQVATSTLNGTVNGTCIDTAGNSSTMTFGTSTVGIDVDMILPVASASATTRNNLDAVVPYVAGVWTNHDVVVTFDCTDAGISAGNVVVDAPVTVSAAGRTAGVVGGCVDGAGNHANPPAFFGPILIDKVGPACAVTVNPNRLSPANSKLVNVTATVKVTDVLSGANGFVLTSITSNKPSTATSDIVGFTTGTASTSGQLRATKGRVYTLTYRGFDVAQNASALCTVQVTVR